jgi:antitoxin component of MazEF toxin-antitoxin module
MLIISCDKKMPIEKTLIKFGKSRAVILPKGWISYAEKQQGQEMQTVALEVNGAITIKPSFDKANNDADTAQH